MTVPPNGWLLTLKRPKTTYHTIEAFKHFAGPTDKILSFYSDNAPELVAAATSCHWRLATATTGMPQTNGVAENCVRRTKEGGGCGIVQSGLSPATFWPLSVEHFCFACNIALVDGDSAYNKRHKTGHFKGFQFPFGALVDFMPQPDTRVESIGAKTIQGVFVGYHIHPGGLWSGDYLVADLAPFRIDCDATRNKVKVHRIREIVTNHSGKFTYPVAIWRHKRSLLDDQFGPPADPEILYLNNSDDDLIAPVAGGPQGQSSHRRCY